MFEMARLARNTKHCLQKSSLNDTVAPNVTTYTLHLLHLSLLVYDQAAVLSLALRLQLRNERLNAVSEA